MSSVETTDLEQIVLSVRQESERLSGGRRGFRLRGFHRVAFLSLRIVAFSVPIALGLLLLGIGLDALQERLQVEWFEFAGSLPAVLLFIWLPVALLLLLPLAILNLPLLVAAWRERRPIVKRDLLEPVLPAWQRKARWLVLALTAAALLLAWLWRPFGWAGFLLFLAVVVLPFALLMMQSFLKLVQRNLELLRSVQELSSVLEQKLAEARSSDSPTVELSHEVAVELSETAQGLRRTGQLRAIDESLRHPSSGYSVRQSSEFRRRLETMDPNLRLELMDHAQRLGDTREPSGAELDQASGHWIWPLPALGLELVYEIAEERNQVLIHDARATAGGGGDSHGTG